jgi:prepilin-type N-terminal cleavage/methylation domain-containing protein
MNPSTSFLRVPQVASVASCVPQPSAGASRVRPIAPSANCVQRPALRRNCGQQLAPGASAGAFPQLAVSPAASARHGSSGSRPVAIHRAAFTLVELLVVIGIIGLLAAISVPVVMQSLAKARNAAIKAEIDMLHMAIMNYKNEYGSFPPAFDAFPLPPAAPTSTGIVNRHLTRLFPRIQTSPVDLRANFEEIAGLYDTDLSRNPLKETRGLVPWLRGYSPNPLDPLAKLLSPGDRRKLFDFDSSRIVKLTETRTYGSTTYSVISYIYYPPGNPSSPYLYINSAAYSALPYDVAASPGAFGAHRQTYTGDLTPFTNVGVETNDWFNPDTFQILCAGRDGEFGTGDDLSNFWAGTRQEYLDSLKN